MSERLGEHRSPNIAHRTSLTEPFLTFPRTTVGAVTITTWGEIDRFLFNEGRHWELWRQLGAHHGIENGVVGTRFSVWAPNAAYVNAVGDWNDWDRFASPLAPIGATGIFSAFVAGAVPGQAYKFSITTAQDWVLEKADPFAFATEEPPRTASVIYESNYEWNDGGWLEKRKKAHAWNEQMSVYEVHLGSWRAGLNYREMATEIAGYATSLGFTHVELLPVAEHPYGPSWGYQVSGYFAPTSRFGSPDDFRAFVDILHQHELSVIVDWVPAHFPKDEWSLGRFDGTALYEHADPRQGEHPDWGTYVFNFGRLEVKNFLIVNALYWLEEFHIDGLRVDAVASMLYLDYSRKNDQWIPNRFGGRENLDAIDFLREMNTVVGALHPDTVMLAEESTSWPAVSRPVDAGGLGFGFKWNMGWMNDTLRYFSKDPIHRKYHHHDLTFGLIYAFSESFLLPLSHDEVVHGKRSLLSKMPGDAWQMRANLRALYAWTWAHPGKQLVFMGSEFGQWQEWNSATSLDWWLLDDPAHAGIQRLVRDLNFSQAALPALFRRDGDADAFRWLVVNDAAANVYAFLRFGQHGDQPVVCVANMAPVERADYPIHFPVTGSWRTVINTDDRSYGGEGRGPSEVRPNEQGIGHLLLPSLGVLWLTPA